MPSLRELQRSFAGALFAPEDSEPAFAIAGSARAAERIAIYRNAVFANYRNALGATYPVVRRLVGAPFFNTAVDAFVRGHPSASGDLNVYGDVFADFLASYPYAADLPYLPDVARLEWAIDEAQRAADVPRNPEAVLVALSAVPSDQVAALRFRVDPSCRLVASSFPILRIWQVNQPDHEGDDRVDLDAGADAMLVRREANGVSLSQLAPGEHAFLAALVKGAPLSAAMDAAQAADAAQVAADAAFDLGASLRKHIASGTISELAVS
jgi:hypothetical protein